MDITERHVGSVAILDLKGQLVCDDGDRKLIAAVNALIERGERHVLLNLEGVPWIDSAGIGALAAKYMSVRRSGGMLKLVHLTARTAAPLRITRLTTIFDIFTSESDALRAFSTTSSV